MKNIVKSTYKLMITELSRWINRIYPSPKKFEEKDLENRMFLKEDYKVVANSVASTIEFSTVIDVGCAQGFLMEPLLDKGFEVWGADVSGDVKKYLPEELKDRVEISDFSDIDGSYDLVACIEVAEHIPPTRSQELVEKLCSLSNEYIFFTAAPPGQTGHGHINCRQHKYWIKKFKSLGFKVDKSKNEKLNRKLKSIDKANHLKKNFFLLKN